MFGKRLRSVREQRGLSQQQLADRVGTARVTITMYEAGEREPNFEMLSKLAEVLEVSTDYLLGRTDDPRPPETPQSVPWWERDDPPSEIELIEFIREQSNLRLMGNPLDERAKEDVLLALRVIWQHMQEQKKRARESENKNGRGKEPTPENA